MLMFSFESLCYCQHSITLNITGGGGGVTASIQGTSVINHRQIVLTQKRLKMTSVYLSILIYFVAIVTHIEDAQF